MLSTRCPRPRSAELRRRRRTYLAFPASPSALAAPPFPSTFSSRTLRAEDGPVSAAVAEAQFCLV